MLVKKSKEKKTYHCDGLSLFLGDGNCGLATAAVGSRTRVRPTARVRARARVGV